jgi:hypothetical protein
VNGVGKACKDTVPFPRTLEVVEAFRFGRGRITRIDGYDAELIYGVRSPWRRVSRACRAALAM